MISFMVLLSGTRVINSGLPAFLNNPFNPSSLNSFVALSYSRSY